MTELKEIVTALFFSFSFTLGFTMGIFSAIGIYYSSKRKKEIDQEEDEAIAEQEKEKPKTLRDYCIDLSHYDLKQRRYIYTLLNALNEPMWKTEWLDENFLKEPSVLPSKYLGFNEKGSKSWCLLADIETQTRNLEQVDYNTFIKILNGVDSYNTYQELFSHMSNEHDLNLHDSEMDEIIRIVDRIK